MKTHGRSYPSICVSRGNNVCIVKLQNHIEKEEK